MLWYCLTWNLYSKDKSVITPTTITTILENIVDNYDVIVLGFQEVSHRQHIINTLIHTPILNKFYISYNSISQKAFSVSNFDVLLIILSRKPLDIIKKINVRMTTDGHKNRLSRIICTKGITGIHYNYDSKTYLILCCHLPVFHPKNYERSINTLLKTIQKNVAGKTIILGDLNSRFSSSLLPYLQYDQLHKNHNIYRLLIEAPITFRPTYKLDYKSGQYHKYKKNIGYTDRILFRNMNYFPDSYQSLPLIGSDHFPVTISLYD